MWYKASIDAHPRGTPQLSHSQGPHNYKVTQRQNRPTAVMLALTVSAVCHFHNYGRYRVQAMINRNKSIAISSSRLRSPPKPALCTKGSMRPRCSNEPKILLEGSSSRQEFRPEQLLSFIYNTITLKSNPCTNDGEFQTIAPTLAERVWLR